MVMTNIKHKAVEDTVSRSTYELREHAKVNTPTGDNNATNRRIPLEDWSAVKRGARSYSFFQRWLSERWGQVSIGANHWRCKT